MKARVISYLENFYDKVEDDTLTLKEGLTVFLAGAAITLILTWVASFIGGESTFILSVLIFGLITALVVADE